MMVPNFIDYAMKSKQDKTLMNQDMPVENSEHSSVMVIVREADISAS